MIKLSIVVDGGGGGGFDDDDDDDNDDDDNDGDDDKDCYFLMTVEQCKAVVFCALVKAHCSIIEVRDFRVKI